MLILQRFHYAFLAIVFVAVMNGGAICFAADSEKITVEAEGSGETKIVALKEAWTDAVRKAVGMYMTSKSEVKTEALADNYTEEIAAYSRGQVNSFQILSENQANGLWTVKIRANVDKDVMQETVANATSVKVKVDGGNLAAQTQSAADKKKDALEVIKSSGLMDFGKCLIYEPSVTAVDFEGTKYVFFRHLLKMDLVKFKKQSDELEKLVAQMAISVRDAKMNSQVSKMLLKYIGMKSSDIALKLSKKTLNNSALAALEKPEEECELMVGLFSRAEFLYKSSDGLEMSEKISPLVNDQKLKSMFFTVEDEVSGDEICFFKASASAKCYKLPETTVSMLKAQSLYELSFKIESGINSFDSLGNNNKFVISFANNIKHSVDSRMSLICPAFTDHYIVGSDLAEAKRMLNMPQGNRGLDYNFYSDKGSITILMYYEKLNLSAEELSNLKELTGKYVLTPMLEKK